MENRQPLITIHRMCGNRQGTEMTHHIIVDLLQAGTGLPDAVCFDSIGQADTALIPALGNLPHQHIAVFLSDFIELVALWVKGKHFPVLHQVCRIADHGKFKAHRRPEIVDQLAVKFKQNRLFIVRRFGIVDVIAEDAFTVKPVRDAADAVRIHFFIGNGLLGGLCDFTLFFCPPDCLFHTPFVGGGQLGVGPDHEMFPAHGCSCRWLCSEWKQVVVPPFHSVPAAPERQTGCWSGKVWPQVQAAGHG